MFATGHADHAKHGTKREQLECDARQLNWLLTMGAQPLIKALVRQSKAIQAMGVYAQTSGKAPKDFPKELLNEDRAATRGGTGAKLMWICPCNLVNPPLNEHTATATCCGKSVEIRAW